MMSSHSTTIKVLFLLLAVLELHLNNAFKTTTCFWKRGFICSSDTHNKQDGAPLYLQFPFKKDAFRMSLDPSIPHPNSGLGNLIDGVFDILRSWVPSSGSDSSGSDSSGGTRSAKLQRHNYQKGSVSSSSGTNVNIQERSPSQSKSTYFEQYPQDFIDAEVISEESFLRNISVRTTNLTSSSPSIVSSGSNNRSSADSYIKNDNSKSSNGSSNSSSSSSRIGSHNGELRSSAIDQNSGTTAIKTAAITQENTTQPVVKEYRGFLQTAVDVVGWVTVPLRIVVNTPFHLVAAAVTSAANALLPIDSSPSHQQQQQQQQKLGSKTSRTVPPLLAAADQMRFENGVAVDPTIGRGIFGGTMRLIRRRLLNIWEDQPQWVTAVSAENASRNNGATAASSAAADGVYVTTRRIRRPRSYDDVLAAVGIVGRRNTSSNNDQLPNQQQKPQKQQQRRRKRDIVRSSVQSAVGWLLSPLQRVWIGMVQSQEEYLNSDSFVPTGASSLVDASSSQYSVFKRRKSRRDAADDSFDGRDLDERLQQKLLSEARRKRRFWGRRSVYKQDSQQLKQQQQKQQQQQQWEQEQPFRFGVATAAGWLSYIGSALSAAPLLAMYTQNSFSTGAPLTKLEPVEVMEDTVSASEETTILSDLIAPVPYQSQTSDSSDQLDLPSVFKLFNKARVAAVEGLKRSFDGQFTDAAAAVVLPSTFTDSLVQIPVNMKQLSTLAQSNNEQLPEGINKTAGSFKTLMQAGKEFAEDSGNVMKEAVGSTVTGAVNAVISAPFWPWDKFNRGQIPFFENSILDSPVASENLEREKVASRDIKSGVQQPGQQQQVQQQQPQQQQPQQLQQSQKKHLSKGTLLAGAEVYNENLVFDTAAFVNVTSALKPAAEQPVSWWNYFPLSSSVVKGVTWIIKSSTREVVPRQQQEVQGIVAANDEDTEIEIEKLREVTGSYIDIYNKDKVKAELERNSQRFNGAAVSASTGSSAAAAIATDTGASTDPWILASLELHMLQVLAEKAAQAVPAAQVWKIFQRFRGDNSDSAEATVTTDVTGSVGVEAVADLPYDAKSTSPAVAAVARAAAAKAVTNDSKKISESIRAKPSTGSVVDGISGVQTFLLSSDINTISSSTPTTAAEISTTRASVEAAVATAAKEVSNKKSSAVQQSKQVQQQPLPPLAVTPVRLGRAQELKDMPDFVDVPLPSKADFAFIAAQRIEVALVAAMNIRSETDAREFLKYIGVEPLIKAVLGRVPKPLNIDRVDAVKSICRLTRHEKTVAATVAANEEVISVLCDMMESPYRGFKSFQSITERTKKLRAQTEATALIQRFVRSSDQAVELLRRNERLRSILNTIVQTDAAATFGIPFATASAATAPLRAAVAAATASVATATTIKSAVSAKSAVTASRAGSLPHSDESPLVKKYQVNKSNSTTIVDYVNLTPQQMARVALWGLGGVQWKPRQPGQRGLRILTFDGGGTKGVLSIAFLKEIMNRVNRDQEPHQIFDMICGTSTGGIIAGLLAGMRCSLEESEQLYDELIGEIFGQKSNLQLVTKQAAYDEKKWEQILHELLGNQLLLDTNQYDCPRLFFISTKVNANPPLPKVWRNYNYPPGQESRYAGTFRINLKTAVRATTAAPTFFTPVPFESGLYCDGALVANNPTAIAIQEAKILYPGVPIEMVVSIGTGYINELSNIQYMGWDLLVNQLIASSTDTEDVHALLVDFLPKDQYFRFNPLLSENLPIDEKNKVVLSKLKQIAKDHVREMENGPDGKYFQQLIRSLRGGK